MRDCVYELRRGDEVIATGHLSRDLPLEVGDRITIGVHQGNRVAGLDLGAESEPRRLAAIAVAATSRTQPPVAGIC